MCCLFESKVPVLFSAWMQWRTWWPGQAVGPNPRSVCLPESQCTTEGKPSRHNTATFMLKQKLYWLSLIPCIKGKDRDRQLKIKWYSTIFLSLNYSFLKTLLGAKSVMVSVFSNKPEIEDKSMSNNQMLNKSISQGKSGSKLYEYLDQFMIFLNTTLLCCIKISLWYNVWVCFVVNR